MTYFAGIQMFIEKLNQLINCNDNPLINNNIIICERPQFQLLYEELGSMIQNLFIHEHQDLHELNFLKKRFIYAAEEAQYIVDLFLSAVHHRNKRQYYTSEDFELSLNIDDVRRSLRFIKVKLLSKNIDNMKLDSPQTPEGTLNQSAATAPRNSLASKLDEIIVGFDGDAELIRDKLVEDRKTLDVVSIVGMGGIGKTTLATKVFNDGFIKHHFHVRVWVTVSQTYDKRDVLIQILESIHAQLHLEKATDTRLRELVHKHLMGKRYLIVIDDIWHKRTWDQVNLFFPHDNTGSRIMLTTRITEVAKHANSNGFIHHLAYLNKERSWELLCKKVFRDNECPQWLIEYGLQIVENCKGLPLSVVIIAGILAKEAWSKELWVEIADKTGSYIVGDQNGCLETLALSYNHLPFHIRECFLHLGRFPEDHKFEVKRLIWLWVAEGFIQQGGNRSLEDTAESYLMDLIDRNLVVVTNRRKSNGAVKACTLHDLVRELCLRKAKEEEKIPVNIRELVLPSQFINIITRIYKPVRLFIDKYNRDKNILVAASHKNLRSILFLTDFGPSSDDIAKYFRSFTLLRVLDLQRCSLDDFPDGVDLLVHLRYLAIRKTSAGFPSSICKLWGLQTLIYITRQETTVLPRNISNLVNLRHLWNYHPSSLGIWSFKMPFFLPSIEKPMHLQTISNVVLGNEIGNFQKCFPHVKKLICSTYTDSECDFNSLTDLEELKLSNQGGRINCITFPTTLRALTLFHCRLSWSRMSIIQSLPNLQVLKLKRKAFEGSCWDTHGHEFRQLKFLRLDMLDIKKWEACAQSFPCLEQVEICSCIDLEDIPLEIGDVPTLKLIRIKSCRDSVNESVRRIEGEQNDFGNYDLKIDIIQKF